MVTSNRPEGTDRGGSLGRWPRVALVRLALTLLTLAGLVALVVTQRSVIASSLDTLREMNWVWLPVALALEWASIATFARMQRRLFRAGDKRVTLRPVLATAFAGNAISVSVPVAGPQLGTAFAFRRFRRLGIDSALAGWTLVVSGVVSSLTAGLILVTGAVVSGDGVMAATGAIGGLVGVAALAGAEVAFRGRAFETAVERLMARVHGLVERLPHLAGWRPNEAPSTLLSRLRALRLGPRDWAKVSGLALANWLTDAGVLVVSILAVGGAVPWRGLLLVYAVRMAAGGVSLTPGGVGVVEGALAVALMAVGLQRPSALAAVLVYRFISFWMVTAAGWLVYLIGKGEGVRREASRWQFIRLNTPPRAAGHPKRARAKVVLVGDDRRLEKCQLETRVCPDGGVRARVVEVGLTGRSGVGPLSVRPNIRPNNAVPKRPAVSHLVPVDRPARPSDQPRWEIVGRPATQPDKVSPTCNRQVVGSSPTAGSR
jgi:uncharacterized protein (TIRG00374 family)